MNLFNHHRQEQLEKEAPLAARMRPESFDEFVGQEHIVGEGCVLRRSIEADQLPSIILWGPPGSGKTTLAHIIANTTRSHFSAISAVSAGVAEVRRIIDEANKRRALPSFGDIVMQLHREKQEQDEAKERRALYQHRTVLFIDEIHRFNKAQQDVILPFVENGEIILIGATIDNPSFEVVPPLLSRCRVFTLNRLTDEQMELIVKRALSDEERGLGKAKVGRARRPPWATWGLPTQIKASWTSPLSSIKRPSK